MMPAICVHICYAKIVRFLIQGILTVLKEEGKPEPRWAVGHLDFKPSPRRRDASSLTIALLATLAPQQSKLKPFFILLYNGNMTP